MLRKWVQESNKIGSIKEITITGDVTFSGFYDTTFTLTADTSLTLPTTGTLATVGGALGAPSVTAITGADSSLGITGQATAQGGAIVITGGTSSTSGNAGGAVSLVGGTPGATGVGGAVSVTAAAGGATSGTGGAASLTAGNGTAGNANGGTLTLTAGTAHGSGISGAIISRGLRLRSQPAVTAKTVSATLTAAELRAGIITVNQAAGAGSTLTLPLATDMDTGFPDATTNDAFDFYVINTSTVDAEDATIATNTGWTLVGNLEVQAKSANTLNTSGHFRAHKTGTAAWTLYRLA